MYMEKKHIMYLKSEIYKASEKLLILNTICVFFSIY